MRVVRALLVVGLLGTAGCAADSGPDPEAAESLKNEVVTLLGRLDAGDYVGMLANADSNVVIMDFDENNAPLRTDGIAESRAFMTRMTETAKSQGLKFTSTIVRNEAWTYGPMGYAVVDYDQTIAMGGQTMGPFKFRGTMVGRRAGDRWLMTHWHGSFRELPGAPADTAAAPR
jgi:hypothetical protein